MSIQPQLMLLPRNVSGTHSMARRIRRSYGVTKIFFDLRPYSSQRHHALKSLILKEHVRDIDWVIQADADEFVLFPGANSAVTALETLEFHSANVHAGVMVDRLAAGGDLQRAVERKPSLFSQYPLNCAITTMLQQSDIRKVSAYRGNIRTCAGNHNFLGYNFTTAARVLQAAPKGRQRILQGYRHRVRTTVSDDAFKHFPERLAEARVFPPLASVFHFKWTRGVAEKLRRRVATEPATSHLYWGMRKILEGQGSLGEEVVAQVCRNGTHQGSDPVAVEEQELGEIILGRPESYLRLQTVLRDCMSRWEVG